MKNLRRALIGVVGTAALLLPFATPASAQQAGVVVFAGRATTPPLGYPVLDSTPGGGTVLVNSGIACATAGTGGTGTCGFNASGSIGSNGVLGAYCGASGGSLNGTLSVGANSVGFSGNFTTAGSLVVFSGSANINGDAGIIVAVADAIPPNPATGGGSCLDGSATTFIVVGAATYAAV